LKQKLRSIRLGTTAVLVLCTFSVCAQVRPSSGALSGVVRDGRGIPQMGAAVELLTPSSAEVSLALTDMHGRYHFTGIRPGHYALKVTAAAFLPTLREHLHLSAGYSVVNLTLNTLFEAAQWVPAQRRAPDETQDDWKWTLRSSVNRPILRWDDDGPTVVVASNRAEIAQRRARVHATVSSGTGEFASSGTHAVLEAARADVGNGVWMVRSDVDQGAGRGAGALSAGLDRQILHGLSETDLRTVASIRELSDLTVGGPDTVRVATFVLRGAESTRLAGLAEIAAGSETAAVEAPMNSTGRSDRVVATRPFLTVRTNPDGKNGFAYRFASSPAYQGMKDFEGEETLPRFSLSHGNLVLESDAHNSLAFEHHTDKSRLEAAIYTDHFSHPILNGVEATPAGLLGQNSVVFDPGSGALRVGGRSYTSDGIHLSGGEEVAPEMWATIEFSTGTALVLGPAPFRQARDLENAIASLTPQVTSSIGGSLRGKIAGAGTVWRAAYRWQPSGTLTSVDAFDNPSGDAYLSIYIRQPICGHQNVEAVFDIRNLLAEGYRPVMGSDGHMFFLAQQPRSLRGGLAFSF